jgi:hypothetical protein
MMAPKKETGKTRKNEGANVVKPRMVKPRIVKKKDGNRDVKIY